MRQFTLLLILFGITIGLPPAVRAEDAPKAEHKTLGPYDVEVKKDLAYRDDKDADPVRHKLDIFIPQGQKNYPVLLFVHGGTWKSGSKSYYAPLGKTFASYGIGTVLINYRLSKEENEIKYSDQIADVAQAFAWVKKNIAKYGGDGDDLFVSGHSAGGHLAALLATDDCYLKTVKLGLKNIKGVISLSGVYTISPIMRTFTRAFSFDAAACEAASPMSHITDKHPPFLIPYADKDLLGLDKMAEEFCKKLTDKKCEAATLKIKDRDHITIIVDLAGSGDDPCTSAMFDFIAKHSDWKKPSKHK